MKNRFEEGDKIRCIDNLQAENYLVVNEIYEVVFSPHYDADIVRIKGHNFNGLSAASDWYCDRFELVNTNSEPVVDKALEYLKDQINHPKSLSLGQLAFAEKMLLRVYNLRVIETTVVKREFVPV